MEHKYRLLKTDLLKGKSRNGQRSNKLAQIKKCRNAIYQTFLQIDITEDQANALIEAVAQTVRATEASDKSVEKASRMRDPGRQKALREARAELRHLAEKNLASAAELKRILKLVY